MTALQRFGGSVNLHLHFHTLVLDGIFALGADDRVVFHPAAPPTDAEVARVTARVRRRIEALLVRRGIATVETDDDGADPLADESSALAGLTAAAVRGRTALGQRAGRGPVRVGTDPDAPWVDRHDPLQAHDAGYDLHAAVAVLAGDRAGLERLCRYVFRPPLGQHRLRRLPDGRVAVALQHEWADGTSHLVFQPGELLERLATLVPRPRVNLLIYHGVLAPNGKWRRAIVPGPPPEEVASPRIDADSVPEATVPDALAQRRARPKYRAWADLMRRAFELDVGVCPRCGGRMHVIATIEDPAVIHRILAHLGLSETAGEPLAARAPPTDEWTEG